MFAGSYFGAAYFAGDPYVASGSGFTGNASLSGTGTLTTSASVGLTGTATLSGSGTLTTTASPGLTGAATLSGTGTLSGVGAPGGVTGSAALSGTGTLTTSATVGLTGAAALAGVGTLTTSARVGLAGVAGLSGVGTLAGVSTGVSGTASFTGSGTLFGIGTAASTGTVIIMAATAPTVVFDSPFDKPFYAGTSVAAAALVPGQFPVAINGRPYILNTDKDSVEIYGTNFREDSLPLLRDQTDQGNLPGEQSLSPAQFWRRSQDDWRGGAGQSILDRATSDITRYNASKGINPWTAYQMTLLNDTTRILTSANSGLVGTTANGTYYVADGTTVRATANLTGFTAVTGTPASQALDMCSDGALVYGAFGASGIYSINGTTATSYVTGTVSHVGFAKGRLLAANNGALYNPTTSGALPTALITIATTGWIWTSFCEGDTQIYAAGFAGDTSRIYRITAQPDGTALTVPIVAATLPKGEAVRSLLGYLGFVIVGTDKGVRFATADSASGDLTLGALIQTPAPVYCLDAFDHFVWFGWSNYDSTSTGLGRFDLLRINDGNAPAFAADLMGTGQGTVRSLGMLLGRHVFAVDTLGVFAESLLPVASGMYTTGQISYGISDPKVPLFIDLKTAPLATGSYVSVAMSLDRGTATTVGVSNVPGSVSPAAAISLGARRAEETELTFTLVSSVAGDNPTLVRFTLLAYPAPTGASVYVLPIILAASVDTYRNIEYSMDPKTEYEFLRGLNSTREVITCQVGSATFQGTLEEFHWIPDNITYDQAWWSGTFVAKIRRIS